jgi:hypothetical protein
MCIRFPTPSRRRCGKKVESDCVGQGVQVKFRRCFAVVPPTGKSVKKLDMTETGTIILPQAASRKPQAASRKPQAASRKPQAASRKPQAASRVI